MSYIFTILLVVIIHHQSFVNSPVPCGYLLFTVLHVTYTCTIYWINSQCNPVNCCWSSPAQSSLVSGPVGTHGHTFVLSGLLRVLKWASSSTRRRVRLLLVTPPLLMSDYVCHSHSFIHSLALSSPTLSPPFLHSLTNSESESLYDWRFTANHFVLATSPLRTRPIILFFNWTLAVIVLM
jgi:hypothetical protein